jgi:hypothetical protein
VSVRFPNRVVPKSLSVPNIKNDKSVFIRMRPRSPNCISLDRTISNDTNFPIEVIICLVTGSEYHQITESFDHRDLGIPACLDLIRKIKPDFNLAMLQHVPTEEAVDLLTKYHNSR